MLLPGVNQITETGKACANKIVPDQSSLTRAIFFCFLHQMIGPYKQLEDSILEFQVCYPAEVRDIVGRVKLKFEAIGNN